MQLTFLGTGSSMGVPVIGCPCAVCHSPNPKNRRLRTSALLEWKGKKILIDAGPDLREQALLHQIDHLDGIILTHSHYDHIGGLDELRVYSFIQKQPIPCLIGKETFDELKVRYAHLFQEPDRGKTLAAALDFQIAGEGSFLELPFRRFFYRQAGTEVMGLRFGPWAYVTDIKEYPETIFENLQGVEVLMLSALRPESSHLHFSLDEAIAFAQKVGAKRNFFIHIAHEIDADCPLPDGAELAYDGQVIR